MRDLLDNERIRIAIISFLIGVLLAFVVFPKRELETVYKTTIERLTDTLYITKKDTVYVLDDDGASESNIKTNDPTITSSWKWELAKKHHSFGRGSPQ